MRTTNLQVPLPGKASLSVAGIRGARRTADRWYFLAAIVLAVALTPAMAFLQLRLGFGLTMGLLIAVTLTILMVFWPVVGIYTLAFCAVVVEQGPLSYPIFTDHLYIFYWPAQLQGLPERPIGFLALFILLLIIARRLIGRMGAPLRLGPLFWPFAALLVCVAIGVAHGLTSGGDPKVIVLEVRPFWYLFLCYTLAYNLISHRRHALALLWITVLGTFIKALQGTYIVFGKLGGHISGQNEIMAHEQSFFFVLVLLIILLCILLGRMRLLMWIALISTPFLLIALVANNRRADYVAFLIGAVGVWLFAVIVRPKQRALLIVAAVIVGVLFSGYVLAFQNSTGGFGSIATAVVSVVHPRANDLRDASSNAYRYIENFDLLFTEKQSPIIGYGFGKPFLQPTPLPNIIGLDPYYLYIPHNTLLWVWMRLGPLGYMALWYLVGSFIIRAGVIARNLRDPQLRLLAIFGIGAMLMEIPLAYGDYQLFFYRNIFYLGLLMGALMRLPSLDTPAQAIENGTNVPTDRDSIKAVRSRSQALPAWEGITLARVGASAMVRTANALIPLLQGALVSLTRSRRGIVSPGAWLSVATPVMATARRVRLRETHTSPLHPFRWRYPVAAVLNWECLYLHRYAHPAPSGSVASESMWNLRVCGTRANLHLLSLLDNQT